MTSEPDVVAAKAGLRDQHLATRARRTTRERDTAAAAVILMALQFLRRTARGAEEGNG